MILLQVTQEQQRTLLEHLQLARDWTLGSGPTDGQRFAWLRKARALLLMLDPHASKPAGDGIVSRTYWDFTADIDKISAHSGSPDFHLELAARYQAAISSFEAVVDCIRLAPGSLVSRSLRVLNPYFFELPEGTDENLVFVLMPFTEPWSDRIWGKHIKPIVEALDIDPQLKCKRADDLYGRDVLLDIVAAVKMARVVVADITSRNSNVFYELGIAHTFGRPVILLTQTVDDIPFDLLRFRHIIYEDNSDGYPKLEAQLKGAILEAIA